MIFIPNNIYDFCSVFIEFNDKFENKDQTMHWFINNCNNNNKDNKGQ